MSAIAQLKRAAARLTEKDLEKLEVEFHKFANSGTPIDAIVMLRGGGRG